MPPTATEVRQRTLGVAEIPSEISNGHFDPHNNDGNKYVGIDGKWYDVTNFIPNHPGGPIIEQFIGEDATHVFHAYGHGDVLKHRKVVGTYHMKERLPCDKDFEELEKLFKEKGYFETDFIFYVNKVLVIFSIFATVWFLVTQTTQWYLHYFAAFVLAFFFQQSGFIMHDFMHSQVFRTNRVLDRAGGVVFGAACFGISSHWWQDEHILHHGLTNVVDVANRWVDPQMWESVWAQNTKLFPLFTRAIDYVLIKIQHITFVPVVVFVGRYEICTDSFRRERRWYEWVGFVVHYTWMILLLSCLPTWRERAIFYFIAASVQGIFHFQLILSHYCQAFLNIDEFHRQSWYKFMIDSNLNLTTYRIMDWYYGGLNFHIEHHLYPKLARKHLRSAAPYVQEVCKKHNITYESLSFPDALWKTLVHLKKAGSHYSLDPR